MSCNSVMQSSRIQDLDMLVDVVLLTLWQKLQTVSRQTLTTEGMKRTFPNLVE